jgi:hypothetical protein
MESCVWNLEFHTISMQVFSSAICVNIHTEISTLRTFFRIIDDFVHRFILDRTFVDFTVSLLILPFYIVDFKNGKINSETVKLTLINC